MQQMPYWPVQVCSLHDNSTVSRSWMNVVEMFKVRMQGQYGSKDDKTLRHAVKDMWVKYGFRNGIMRGYWVQLHGAHFNRPLTHDNLGLDYIHQRDAGLCWVSRIVYIFHAFLLIVLADSTQVHAFLPYLDTNSYAMLLAYEFSKRRFAKKYGKDLPVWALLASGSTGGVSDLGASVFHSVLKMQ